MDGFEGAPVSRLIFAGAGLATLLLPAGVKDALALDLGAVLARGEWWRLVTHHVAFDGLGSAALGMIALFRFKRFERYMGSRKFCVFATVAPACSTALLVGGAVLFRRRDEGAPFFKPASGPYALCFGMYWLFYALVPVTRPKLVEILGARLSDKSFMYLIGAQLLAHAGATSAAPAAAGLAAGAFWLSDALRLRDLALPKRLEPLFAPAPRAPATPGAERRGRARSDDFGDVYEEPVGGGGGGGAPEPPAVYETVTPSDEHVESLVAMGFDRDRAYAALLSVSDNLEAAANKLLSG